MADLSEYELYTNVKDRRGISLETVVPDDVWADPFPTGRLEMGQGIATPYIQPPEQGGEFSLSDRSFGNCVGVNPRLVVVMGTAILTSPYDFIIIDGLRSKAEQREYYRTGKSKTLNSRHLTGDAVDLAIWHNGQVMWVPEMYRVLAAHILEVAEMHGVALEWGGDFNGFFDGPHFQIPRSA